MKYLALYSAFKNIFGKKSKSKKGINYDTLIQKIEEAIYESLLELRDDGYYIKSDQISGDRIREKFLFSISIKGDEYFYLKDIIDPILSLFSFVKQYGDFNFEISFKVETAKKYFYTKNILDDIEDLESPYLNKYKTQHVKLTIGNLVELK